METVKSNGFDIISLQNNFLQGYYSKTLNNSLKRMLLVGKCHGKLLLSKIRFLNKKVNLKIIKVIHDIVPL